MHCEGVHVLDVFTGCRYARVGAYSAEDHETGFRGLRHSKKYLRYMAVWTRGTTSYGCLYTNCMLTLTLLIDGAAPGLSPETSHMRSGNERHARIDVGRSIVR